MSKIGVLFLCLLNFLLLSKAGAQIPCPALNSPEAVIECALLRHPELKVSEAAVNQSVKLEQFARQIPNPELDMRSTYGKSLGDNVINTEMNLGFVLQLGGKRRARIQQAWAVQAEANASLLRTKEDVYISTLSSLIRIRQLAQEIAAMEHALDAFANIQSRYRSYGRLNPEQQISQNIFQVAHGDYLAKKTASVMEQQRYLRNVEFILGEKIDLGPLLYPKPLKTWPKLELNEELNGSGIRLAQAELKQAEAELKSAKSESWPDVRVGPSLEQQTEGPFSYQTYGFNLSFAIPVFNVNQGGRAYANAGLMRAQANLRSQQSRLQAEKEVLIRQYNSVIDALRQMPDINLIEQKHGSAESFFRRGLLSTSLMIEYHRQIVDLIEDQNILEVSAMESLWKVYALEGKIFTDNKGNI